MESPSADPLASVIIAAHNAEGFIDDAIESVLRQSHENVELIVVDDGSDDATFHKASTALAQFVGHRAYQKRKGGVSSARNFGAKRVTDASKYLFFLDADDYLTREALAIMVAHLEAHTDVGLVGCQFFSTDCGGHALKPEHRSRICWPDGMLPRDLRDDELETPLEVFFGVTGQGPFALYRRSVFEQTAGWSEDLWGHTDTDMFIRMALEAPVHYLPNRLYVKRTVPSSLLHQPDRDALYTLLRKKWSIYDPGNEEKRRRLNQARIYYHTWHVPLRNLKVAARAFGEFLKRPRLHGLVWALRLAFDGVIGLFWACLGKKRMTPEE
jgi:glycosyltransferase involved in cell wall biosynthesis